MPLTKFRARVITADSIAAVHSCALAGVAVYRSVEHRARHGEEMKQGGKEGREADGAGRAGRESPRGRTPGVVAQAAAPSKALAPLEPAKRIPITTTP